MVKKQIKIDVDEGSDTFGMFVVLEGIFYVTHHKCDFKNNVLISKDNRVRIAKSMLNGLEKTLDTGLRVEQLTYSKRK